MHKILKTNMIELVSEYLFAHGDLLGHCSHTWKITLLSLFGILPPSCYCSPEASILPSIEFSKGAHLDVARPENLNPIEGRVRAMPA
jgi:hypothetical protein